VYLKKNAICSSMITLEKEKKSAMSHDTIEYEDGFSVRADLLNAKSRNYFMAHAGVLV